MSPRIKASSFRWDAKIVEVQTKAMAQLANPVCFGDYDLHVCSGASLCGETCSKQCQATIVKFGETEKGKHDKF